MGQHIWNVLPVSKAMIWLSGDKQLPPTILTQQTGNFLDNSRSWGEGKMFVKQQKRQKYRYRNWKKTGWLLDKTQPCISLWHLSTFSHLPAGSGRREYLFIYSFIYLFFLCQIGFLPPWVWVYLQGCLKYRQSFHNLSNDLKTLIECLV